MNRTIALVGNPNCGKTTLFNALTGSSQYVGNWPGVTVEKKEGRLKTDKEIVLVDLPGIYSLSPYSVEEVITRDYLMHDRPDVIINIIDATNLERNLYLTTQLMETGIPIIVALNMIDIVEKTGDRIDSKKLAERLQIPVYAMSASRNRGISEMVADARKIEEPSQKSVAKEYSGEIEQSLQKISSVVSFKDDFGKRWYTVKLFERDEKAVTRLELEEEQMNLIDTIIRDVEERYDDDSESIIIDQRYRIVEDLVQKIVNRKQNVISVSDKIDRVVTNRWLALPIFAAVMWLIYYVSVSWIGSIVTDWTNDVFFGEIVIGNVSAWLEGAGASPWLHGLIVDGIINGVGSVIGFIPQLLVLFFFLSLLEDCGYMARVAFIMDRIFRRFGLSGKSFIPMLIGTGCSVPGIMACRTIENERDRKMTIMLTPFIPCGAKLPVFALFTAMFFSNQVWIGPSMYFLGIAVVIISGIFLKKTRMFRGDPAPFVMELPQYRLPALKGIIIHMWERAKSFAVKAGTVIFVASGLIWFLQSFDWTLQMVDSPQSILADIGRVIAPIFAPLGFGSWQAAVATLSGFIAKENVVATFGVLFGLGTDLTESDPALINTVAGVFTAVSAYAFMVFTLLAAPCFAAIGATRREMGSGKMALFAVLFQTLVAYCIALVINQVGSFLFLGGSPIGTLIIGIVLSVLILIGVSRRYHKRYRNDLIGTAQ